MRENLSLAQMGRLTSEATLAEGGGPGQGDAR